MTGGGAVRDCEGQDEDNRVIAASHYIVPLRVGSSESLTIAREALRYRTQC